MNQETTEREINDLCSFIEHHNRLYYIEDKPEISDYEYDKFMRRLKVLAARYPDLVPENSPLVSVGADPYDGGLSVMPHPEPMYSLANALDEHEMAAFFSRVKKDLGEIPQGYSASLKYDGLAVELIYRGGRLFTGLTRGNGHEGENITENLKTVKNIISELSSDRIPVKKIGCDIVIRGEVLMPRDVFRSLNERRLDEGLEPFASPRNAAAGSLKQLDAGVTANRKLVFFPYQLALADDLQKELKRLGNGLIPDRHSREMEFIHEVGFPLPSYFRFGLQAEDLGTYYREVLSARTGLDYEIDGIVVKVDSRLEQNRLGVASRRPRFAIAWKFPPEIKKTVLEKVIFQVGRTGAVTPVGILNPVQIGGVTVSRVTLHNKSEINRKGIREGDHVEVIRSGDVIPKILSVDKSQRPPDSAPLLFPQTCPVCGTTLKQEGGDGGVMIRCPSRECPARLTGKMIHFVSKAAFDIEGLGREVVTEMIAKKLVRDPADFFLLKNQDLDKLERMGEKRKKNLLTSIENAKTVELSRFIYAMGIREVGEKVSRKLARNFPSIDEFMNLKKEDLEVLPDIGPSSSAEITGFISSSDGQALVRKLLDAGVKPYTAKPSSEGALEGKKILFTGALRVNRRRAREIAEKHGAETVSAVSSKVDFLVCGEKPGSKYKKALELGVETITEKQFMEIVNEHY